MAVEDMGDGRYRVSVVRAPFELEIAVSPDAMEATLVRLTPPVGDADPPTREDIITALANVDVTAGLLFDEIDNALGRLAEQDTELRNVPVAHGCPARPGTDAVLTHTYLRPTEEEPDRRIVLVREGDVLITRAPPAPGEPGHTVTDLVIAAPAGQDATVETGWGVLADAGRTRWVVAQPGFGYLETDDQGRLTVVPAVTVSDNKLHAFLDLRAPAVDEPPLTRAELDRALHAAGVVHGLLPDRIEAAWQAYQTRGTLPKPIRVADGTPPRPGRDAGVEFTIDVAAHVSSEADAADRVDYRERGIVHNVNAGDEVGIWHPAAPGTPGTGVDGSLLPAPTGRDAPLQLGENVETEPGQDGAVRLLTAIDGAVRVGPGGEVSVVDLIEVDGDVDFHVGNIDANGSVLIKGTVREGFRVTAKHDVTVQGSIEDAIVEAGETVLVKQGIIGRKSGHVRAGRHVSANYAQHATIWCGGDVVIRDSDTNSAIECRGSLVATEGYGKLMGGRYVAGAGVHVRTLGSDFGAPTRVIVGEDPGAARELVALDSRLAELTEQEQRIRDAFSRTAMQRLQEEMDEQRARTVQRLIHLRREIAAAIETVQKRWAEVHEIAQGNPAATVDVLDRVYYGVDVQIAGVRYHTDEIFDRVRFRCDPAAHQILLETL